MIVTYLNIIRPKLAWSPKLVHNSKLYSPFAFNPTNKVTSEDGNSKVGKISKQWTGLIKEHFTDADNFGINFPMDLDVNVKATLLGACFLIVSSVAICVNVFACLVIAVNEWNRIVFDSLDYDSAVF